ncbi:Segregation and condensation protein B, partial [hydrothermal vent metagenome]
HKDVPGRPSMYGTTREFLDYFNLKSLNDLPSLADLIDFEKLHPELALEPDVAVDKESSENDCEILAGDESESPVVDGENDTPIGDKETLIVD